MENQFTKIMSERSDEQLIEIVTTDRHKYNEAALVAAEKELETRNIDKAVLDQTTEILHIEKENQHQVELNSASSGKRFLNYLIDVIASHIFAVAVVLIITFIFPFDILRESFLATILLVASFFAYYISMEVVFQKTLGKFVTKTKVVTLKGHKPRERDIVLRTFCRLIPFDHISFLFTKNGFHDSLSKTKVIKDH